MLLRSIYMTLWQMGPLMGTLFCLVRDLKGGPKAHTSNGTPHGIWQADTIFVHVLLSNLHGLNMARDL